MPASATENLVKVRVRLRGELELKIAAGSCAWGLKTLAVYVRIATAHSSPAVWKPRISVFHGYVCIEKYACGMEECLAEEASRTIVRRRQGFCKWSMTSVVRVLYSEEVFFHSADSRFPAPNLRPLLFRRRPW